MTGPTIIVSTTDRIPVMDADVVLDLTPEEGRAMWQLVPDGPQVAILRQLDPAGRQRDPRPQLNSGRFMPAVPDSTDPDAASASTFESSLCNRSMHAFIAKASSGGRCRCSFAILAEILSRRSAKAE